MSIRVTQVLTSVPKRKEKKEMLTSENRALNGGTEIDWL
jgi:hypothetical protein